MERRLIASQMKRDSLRNLPASTLHVQYRQTEVITEIFDHYRLAVLGHLVNLRREAASFQHAMMENGLADNASVLRRQQAYEQASRWMDYIRSSMPIETVSDVKQKQYTALAMIDPDLPSLEQWLSNAWSERQQELLVIERAIQDEEIKRYGRDQISLRTKVRYNYFTSPGEQNRGFASVGASLSVPIRWGDTAREGRLAQQQQQREDQLKMEVKNANLQQDSLQVEIQAQAANGEIIALNAQIQKRSLFLVELKKRLAFWQAERERKEKLVYLGAITANELANVDRSIDDVSYQIATVNAEHKVLKQELGQLRASTGQSKELGVSRIHANETMKAFIAPIDGMVDRLRIAPGAVCYKQEIVTSIVDTAYVVKAYVDVNDLDRFHAHDDVVVLLSYGKKKLQGRIRQLYSVIEDKDKILFGSIDSNKYGVVVEVEPTNAGGKLIVLGTFTGSTDQGGMV